MNILSVIAASRRRGDPDAADYFARIVSAGSTISANNQSAVNAFIVGCKADGIWTAIKAACFLAGPDDLTGALVPLVGTAPTNVGGNFVSGDYNRVTGLKGNGATKSLDANRNTNADPQNNHHFAAYATTPTNTTCGVIGGRSSSVNAGTKQLNWIATTGAEFRACSGTSSVVTPTLPSAGLYAASRSNSTGFSARVPSSTSAITLASDGLDGASFFIFARNTSGTALIHSDWRLSFYSIGESLDLAALDARLATYMASIT
jgi:hypothetical protein